ncbi:MAG: hypothetical protein IT201_06630 [Thermoleophilia bacterium]|nr:hypothetical protein [Thermoleophilia bacterium]
MAVLWPAVILTALAVLGFETALALRASGNLVRPARYATLLALALAVGVVLLLLA